MMNKLLQHMVSAGDVSDKFLTGLPKGASANNVKQYLKNGGLIKAQNGQEYTGPSIVDYLISKGKRYDKNYRAALAQKAGIENYDFSADKNLELLARLRNNQGIFVQDLPDPTRSLYEQSIQRGLEQSRQNPFVPQGDQGSWEDFNNKPVTKTVNTPAVVKRPNIQVPLKPVLVPQKPAQISDSKKTTAKTAAKELSKKAEEQSWYDSAVNNISSFFDGLPSPGDLYDSAINKATDAYDSAINTTSSFFHQLPSPEEAAKDLSIKAAGLFSEDLETLARNYYHRQGLKNNDNLQETQTKFTIPNTLNKPDIITGDTININKDNIQGRYIIPGVIDLKNTRWGYRNRGEYKDIVTDGGDITLFENLVPAKEYFANNKNVPESASFIGLSPEGEVLAGNKKDFVNSNALISKTFSNKIVDFPRDKDGKLLLKNASAKASSRHLTPVANIINDDGKIVSGSLNLLIPKNNPKTNSFGEITGGRVLFVAPNGEKKVALGSADDIVKVFDDFKRSGNFPYLTAYTNDNGSYGPGLRKKSGKITAQDLKNYQGSNSTGSVFLYLKPGDYNTARTQNKYKDIQMSTPNIRTEKDESFLKGHPLKNSQEAVVLHHTAFTDTTGIGKGMSAAMKGVDKHFQTPNGASSHVVIDFDGTRYNYAKPDQVTFHAGKSKLRDRENLNDFSLGIEFQGDTDKVPLTDAQIESFVEYIAPLIREKRIPLENIVTHKDIRTQYMKGNPNDKKVETKADVNERDYARIVQALKKKGIYPGDNSSALAQMYRQEMGGQLHKFQGNIGPSQVMSYDPQTDTYESRYSLPEITVTGRAPRDSYGRRMTPQQLAFNQSIHNAQGRALAELMRFTASGPQQAMMYGLTGKAQYPSEAMGIENPYAAFITDFVTDPLVATSLLRTGAKQAGSLLRKFKPKKASQLPDSDELEMFVREATDSPYDQAILNEAPIREPKFKDIPEVNSQLNQLKTFLSYGKRPLIKKDDFFSTKEINDRIAQQKKYYELLEQYEKSNPFDPGQMIFDAFRGDKSYMDNFHNLYPDAELPIWNEKYMHPEHSKLLENANIKIPYSQEVNNPISKIRLRGINPNNILLPSAEGLSPKGLINNWFYKSNIKDYVTEMRGSLGLSFEDINRMSDTELIEAGNKIFSKLIRQQKARLRQDLSGSNLSGFDAFQAIQPNKFGGTINKLPKFQGDIDPSQVMKYDPGTDTYESRYSLPEVTVTGKAPRDSFGRRMTPEQLAFNQRIHNAQGQALSNLMRFTASGPQQAMMAALTGNAQYPSEAIGIENPYVAMLIDVVTDPLVAGSLAKAGVKGLSSLRYKPAPGMMYRGIGEEGFKDAVESGVFRSKQNIVPEYYPGTGLQINKSFGTNPYFTPHFATAESYGSKYLAEVPRSAANWKRRYGRKEWSQVADRPIPITEGRILKKDWLRGYKPVEVPRRPSGSLKEFQNYDKSLSRAADREFVIPLEQQKLFTPKELPGLHLKSTMEGEAISKIVEPRTGLVNVEQALGIIGKESGGADKVALIKRGLGDNIPKKMDYNEFRKVVQDQLIPLERQFSTKNSNYGLGKIGYGKTKPGTWDLENPNEILENQTLILGNKNKFGIGSAAHNNPPETLGHIHFLRNAETPDVLTVTQIQSDAFQGTHRAIPKSKEAAEFSYRKGLEHQENLKNIYKNAKPKMESGLDLDGNPYWYELPDGTVIHKDAYFEGIHGQQKLNDLQKAEIENFTQKQLLDKNHQERYLQELVNYAGERGDINKLRLPTSETAAKVQGYSKNTATGMDEMGLPTDLGYSSEHQTILKKYSEQPKTIKKLFGVEPKVVTDSKGNTWYEFDIPKKFKEGKGEIKAFSIIPPAALVGAGATQLPKQKHGGVITDSRGQWAHPGKHTIVPTPSGRITMQGVEYPVYGQDETGYAQMMYPGGEYTYPGNFVYEVPMMQGGGQKYVDSVFNANKGLNWVQRLYEQNPKSIMLQGQKYPSTHFMESGNSRVYPTIVEMPNGKLQFLGDRAYDYADSTGTFIQFPTDKAARWFGKNYKKGTGILSEFAKGGQMIRRADGSYSQRGLWDNIRANKGSGKKPTKQMLEQERKIKAK